MAVFQSLRHLFCHSSKQCFGRLSSASSLHQITSPLFHPPAQSIRTVGATKSIQIERRFPDTPPHQETVYDTSTEDNLITEEIITQVNSQITNKSHGRLFAVVHLAGRQWKITPEDLLVVDGYWPPKLGDVIRLEKVLLVGSSDFTLVGRPLLQPDLINIQATVIEKAMSHTKTHFYYKKRKQTKTINFYRSQQTMIRINSVDLNGLLNEKRDIEGIENRIF